jgi:hypothetical protein
MEFRFTYFLATTVASLLLRSCDECSETVATELSFWETYSDLFDVVSENT